MIDTQRKWGGCNRSHLWYVSHDEISLFSWYTELEEIGSWLSQSKNCPGEHAFLSVNNLVVFINQRKYGLVKLPLNSNAFPVCLRIDQARRLGHSLANYWSCPTSPYGLVNFTHHIFNESCLKVSSHLLLKRTFVLPLQQIDWNKETNNKYSELKGHL